ncbi:MAG: tetratricopeptide repeat protein [Bacteroidota bacterium]
MPTPHDNMACRRYTCPREAGNVTLEVEALHNIGVTYEAQGDYDDARSYLEEALVLRNKIGDDIKTPIPLIISELFMTG